jgi:hypothetical protein
MKRLVITAVALGLSPAGMTSADPALVSALDPDYDSIACEEGM